MQGKLLRPFWVYPGSSLLQSSRDVFTGEITGDSWNVPQHANIIPIILCTISYRAQDGHDKRHGFTYVQGAADDHELWSEGLTPTLFWSHINFFRNMNHTEEQINQFVETLVQEQDDAGEQSDINDAFDYIDNVTPQLELGKIKDNVVIGKVLREKLSDRFALSIILSENVELDPVDNENLPISTHIFKLQSGSKKSSKLLRNKIEEIIGLVESQMNNALNKPILICCNTGTDMSIGILLALLCRNYSERWVLGEVEAKRLDKIMIRKQLTRLISHLEGRTINTSRATLNSVNNYLM